MEPNFWLMGGSSLSILWWNETNEMLWHYQSIRTRLYKFYYRESLGLYECIWEIKREKYLLFLFKRTAWYALSTDRSALSGCKRDDCEWLRNEHFPVKIECHASIPIGGIDRRLWLKQVDNCSSWRFKPFSLDKATTRAYHALQHSILCGYVSLPQRW